MKIRDGFGSIDWSEIMKDKNYKVEEYYEKCRALISVLSYDGFDEADRSAILWVLTDCFEQLGEVIGTVQNK